MAHIADCPVKDLALTVQHLIEAQDAVDRQIVGQRDDGEKTHDERREEVELRHRYSALQELIAAKRPHALTMQALSPEGALHQIAVVALNIENIWDFVPESDEGHVLEDYRTLQWGLYSVSHLLASMCVTPRERLGVETYMPARLSPFVRTATQPLAHPLATAEERLSHLNQTMEEIREVRAAAWEREDTATGAAKQQAESISLRCENDIDDIIAEAATLAPLTLKGFALKARLLTCVHGSEETNFTTGEASLYRSLVGQLLAAAGLGRIDDGSAESRKFIEHSKAFLTAEAA